MPLEGPPAPLTPVERVQLSRALLETGREPQAVEVAKPLIECSDPPPDLRRRIGSLMLDAGFPLEASGLLEPLVGSGDATPSEVLALAQALERSGGTERAGDLYRSLLAEPSSPIAADAHAGLARLAWWEGDLRGTVEHLRAHADAVVSEPARARAQEAIRRLENLLELRDEPAQQTGGDS